MLELVDLNSAELKEVEEGEKQAQMMMAPGTGKSNSSTNE